MKRRLSLAAGATLLGTAVAAYDACSRPALHSLGAIVAYCLAAAFVGVCWTMAGVELARRRRLP